MTSGEVINGRARAGANLVEAREILRRVPNDPNLGHLREMLARRVERAERVFEAWRTIERGGHDG